MQPADVKKSVSPPAIVALLGGALLVVGPLLTWMSATFNFDKIAEITGIDPQLIQQSGALPESVTAKGLDSDMHGLVALIAGLIVIAGGILLIVALQQRLLGGVLILIGGLLGAAMPIWDLIRKEQALDELSKGLGAVPGLEIGDVVTVSAGIGLWVALAGGVVALIAGVMALMNQSKSAPSMAEGANRPMGTGFDVPPPAPSTPEAAGSGAPTTPVVSEPPAPMPETAPMPRAEPAMPPTQPAMPEPMPAAEPEPDAAPGAPDTSDADQGDPTA